MRSRRPFWSWVQSLVRACAGHQPSEAALRRSRQREVQTPPQNVTVAVLAQGAIPARARGPPTISGLCCPPPLRANQKADSTLRASRAVPHPSTDRALRRLTSEVRRDPVHSTRYGRQRTCCSPSVLLLGGPSYHASKVPWSLDAVTCCVAVCYHKYMDA